MAGTSAPIVCARFTPGQARLVLVGWGAVTAFCVGLTLSPLASGFADAPPRGPSDVALYNAEVQRIRAGEGYYQAAAAELRPRGYPTRSVFNWRTPLPMWLVGSLPHPAGKAILGAACLALLLLAFELVAREAGVRAAVWSGLLLIGALLPCILGELYVMPELWSGVLIALSLCCYGLGRPWLGLAAGLSALFFRELAAPYCLLALVLAWRAGRRRECLAWLAGLAAYGLFFVLHALAVRGLLGPNEIAHPHGWIQFGGAAFVISTCQMSAWLLLLPQWVTAIYLCLAMIGFAGWQSRAGERIGLTVCLFVIMLAVVGQPFNQYWGSMFAPLLCFGAALAPAALVQLWKVAAWRGRQACGELRG